MKTYIISLARSQERRQYITKHVQSLALDFSLVDAIDGSAFSNKDLPTFCEMSIVNANRHWLSNGAIACSLSHLKAYNFFLASQDKCCFIIEDDVILPNSINERLIELELNIHDDEVILLYYTSFHKCYFSKINSINLQYGQLVYPMDISHPITAAAYIIGRKAAEKLVNTILPIKAAADSWSYFYEKKCFSSFRVLYPPTIRVKNFKSTIDYLDKDSWLGKLSNHVQEKKIPMIFQLAKMIRKIRVWIMSSRFYLIDKISPINEELLKR